MARISINLFQGAALIAGALTIGCAPTIHRGIDPAARKVDGGREVKVSVVQGEIKADIRVATAGASMGLIGAFLDAGMNNSRASEAEKNVQEVRQALTGYDFDTLATACTRNTLAQVEWFDSKGITFAKEVTREKRVQQLDAAKTSQVLYTDYSYALTPDFDGVRVSMAALLATKDMPVYKPEDRLKVSNGAYFQRFMVIVPLSAATKEAPVNAKRWAADGGKLPRVALELALSHIQRLFLQSLTQSPDALKAAGSNESLSLAGQRGQLINKSEDGTLLRDFRGDWIFVTSKEM